MEFGLLGPLVVRAGGVALPVTAGKQRVLLAALLLHANEVVGTDDLAAAVWGGTPPGTAQVTLQNYMKRLRQALGPEGYQRIVTRPTGYLVATGAGELDVTRFAELAGAGRAAARAGAWETAAAQLTAALALWRGQPLADVPSPVLAAEVPRLAEMRLAAVEARIDADLHLGRHHEVIAELAALAAAEPLRERLVELLMLALYRSGQQAAALAAYRQARRWLVDHVGIEPGPALRELNQQILRSDPALRPPGPAGPAAAAGAGKAAAGEATGSTAGQAGGSAVGEAAAGDAAKPAAAAGADPAGTRPGEGWQRHAMLPTAVPGFAGRCAELTALSDLAGLAGQADGPAVIAVISGTAGVGKTALAVHWARQHAADFPDGQLYVNLRGFDPSGEPLPAAQALQALLEALGTPPDQIPATVEGRQARYRAQLSSQKILILLDNARDPAQVRPLLPASPGPLVIITSRSDLAGLVAADGARPLPLDVLTPAEARDLLNHRLGPARLNAEPDATAELTRLCARLPLALAITAARAAARPRFPLTAVAAELTDTKNRLDALSTGEDATSARAVFSWSYHSLDPPAARMFRLLGTHPGPDITPAAAASLAAVSPPAARASLRELAQHHLLTEHAPGRYTFHDLLRAYAAEQAEAADDSGDSRAPAHRLLDHYLHSAHAASQQGLLNLRPALTLPPPHPGVTPEVPGSYQAALAWFEAEHHNLIAAVTLAADTGCDAHAWQIPWAMAESLDLHGHWQEWATLQQIAVDAATRDGDAAAQAEGLRLLARVCGQLGQHEIARAQLTEALDLYRQLGDQTGEARAHLSASITCERLGDYQSALGHAEQALERCEATGDRARTANALNNVGWYHIRLGHYEQARDFCQQALALHRELRNRVGLAHAWDSLGYAEHHLRSFGKAAICYSRALVLFREAGDRPNEATILSHLGDTHDAAGDPVQARDSWEQALAILDDLHHPDAAEVRGKLLAASAVSPAEAASL